MKTLVLSMISIAATVAAMTACTSESDPVDEVVNPKDAKIEFGTVISGVQSKAAITATTFDSDLKIGILAVAHANEVEGVWKATDNFMQNVEGTTSSAGSISTVSTYSYPTEDQVDFYAYYPYSASINTGENTVPTINVNIAKKESDQNDYMWAIPNTNQSRVSGKQTLKFNHALSLLDIKVIKENGVTETLSVNKITFDINYSTAKMNLTDGSMTEPSTSSNCTTEANLAIPLETTSANPMASFLLLPNTTIINLIVTIGSVDYKIESPSITLNKGERTTFTVTLSTKGISFDSSINEWSGNNQGGGSI